MNQTTSQYVLEVKDLLNASSSATCTAGVIALAEAQGEGFAYIKP